MRYQYLLNFCLLAFIAVLGSCALATFDRVPGERLSAVPAEWQGTYEYKVKEKDLDLQDSIKFVIHDTWWEIKQADGDQRYYMGDSVALSRYRDVYFISVKNSTRKYWYIYVLKAGKDKQLKIWPVLTHHNGKNLIQKYFEPIPDLSDSSAAHYKMNEEQLLRFFKKELKRKRTLVIKKNNP